MAIDTRTLGNCPHCRREIELPRTGACRCVHCKRSFSFYRPLAVAVSQAEIPAAVLATDARCAFHANNQAVATCERCGDFVCALCSTPSEGRCYCAACFDLLYQRGSLWMTQRSFTLPDTAFTLAVLSLPGLCFYGLGVILAVVGVVLGGMALKQIAAQPDLPGRKQAIAAIAVGVCSLLLLGIALVGISLLPPITI